MNLPVLITFYNRPTNLHQLFRKISDIRGLEFFFASDGPKNYTDSLEVEKCWDLVDSFFPNTSDSKKLKRNTNFGCKIAMKENIDWFFSQNSFGVILEDDCYPHPEFFVQMSSVLHNLRLSKYLTVSSGNYLGNSFTSARISVFPMIWGWGTWAKNWQLYEQRISEKKKMLQFPVNLIWPSKKNLRSFYFKNTFGKRFSEVESGKLDTWDYFLTSTSWKYERLNLHLGGNLVVNNGFNSLATHTKVKAPSWVPSQYLISTLDLSNIDNYFPAWDQELAEKVFDCTSSSLIKNTLKRTLGK